MGSPFLHGLALCISDGDANLPQHLLIDLTDRCSQRPDSSRGIKIENRHEVLMLEILLRIQPTSGHQGVGDADGGGRLKLDFDVEFIVLLQERTVNDVVEVLLMLVPILTRQLSGHINKLLGKIVTSNAVVALQHGRHRPNVLFLQLCLLYTSPSPRDRSVSRMPSSA